MVGFGAKRFTPLISVGNVAEATVFFTEGLGFDCLWQDENYAFLKLGPAAIRLMVAPPDADMSDPRREATAYLDLEGVDAYYAARLPALEKRAKVRVRAPFDQDYGQREFHVIYDNLLIFIGEPIEGPMR